MSFRRNLAASFLFALINVNVSAEIPDGMTKQHTNTNKFQMQLIPYRFPRLWGVPIVIGKGGALPQLLTTLFFVEKVGISSVLPVK